MARIARLVNIASVVKDPRANCTLESTIGCLKSIEGLTFIFKKMANNDVTSQSMKPDLLV